MSGHGSVWLERVVWDHEVAGSNPVAPTIFLPEWAKKHEAGLSRRNLQSRWRRIRASFHAPQACFIYSPFQMKQLNFIPLWSIVPFYSTIWSIRFAHIMREMKNESLLACNAIRPALYYCRKGKLIMEKSSNKLVDLSVAFAVEILNLVKFLKSQHETIIWNQIIHSIGFII